KATGRAAENAYKGKRTEPAAESEAIAKIEIPRHKYGFWTARAVLVNGSAVADRFRHFALRLQKALVERGAKSVVVTSALRGEGKTVTACNLALALASIAAGKRIALLDLDLRSPSIARAMATVPIAGVEEVFEGKRALGFVRIRTDVPSLDVFPVGKPVPDAHELLARPEVGKVLRELESHYDLVICDAPPVLPVPDVPLILPHVGACLLVAGAGSTRQSALREMLELLPREQLVGAFLNRTRSPRHSQYYQGYTKDHTATQEEPDERSEA
ncbi:MAG: CpsD/CapB family tyrosine-protein kinase, partial [Myxococcales bacterium]|nr:CpsD/CapB family tyrosine-protein kinase [Myxococcales bacterium]